MDMTSYRQIMSGRDELLKQLNDKKLNWSSCAAINIIFPDSTHVSPNQACHAGLSNDYEGNKSKGSIAVVSALMKPKDTEHLEEEDAYLFLDWLLNRSPYSETFITKSADEALYYKTIISSSDHPSNLMAAGLVASRRLWEYASVARVMVDLSKAGVNEDLAFYLGHIFRGKFNRGGDCDWGGCTAGHTSLNPGVMGHEEVRRFLCHEPVNLNKKYSENYRYGGYDGMYGSTRKGDLGSHIHKNFPYNGEKGKAVNVNPFPADQPAYGRVKGKSCSYEHLIAGMVDYQHTILADIGYAKQEKAA